MKSNICVYILYICCICFTHVSSALFILNQLINMGEGRATSGDLLIVGAITFGMGCFVGWNAHKVHTNLIKCTIQCNHFQYFVVSVPGQVSGEEEADPGRFDRQN